MKKLQHRPWQFVATTYAWNYKNLKFCRLSHARILWTHFLRFPLILRKDSLTRHARTRCRSLCVHSLRVLAHQERSEKTRAKRRDDAYTHKANKNIRTELFVFWLFPTRKMKDFNSSYHGSSCVIMSWNCILCHQYFFRLCDVKILCDALTLCDALIIIFVMY